jgi:hypothetical protein
MKGNDWVTFTREQALRAHGIRTFSTPPLELQVDAACPGCGRADRWVRTQVLGETPGRTDIVCASCEHDLHTNNSCQSGDCRCPGGFQKIVSRPAQRGGVNMFCYACGQEYQYRDLPFSESEQAGRTVRLAEQAKIGRTPL